MWRCLASTTVEAQFARAPAAPVALAVHTDLNLENRTFSKTHFRVSAHEKPIFLRKILFLFPLFGGECVIPMFPLNIVTTRVLAYMDPFHCILAYMDPFIVCFSRPDLCLLSIKIGTQAAPLAMAWLSIPSAVSRLHNHNIPRCEI